MIVVKHQPKSPQADAERQRRAAATAAAQSTIAAIKASKTSDPEFRMEVCRALIRGTAVYAAQLSDAARALGLLAGAAADVCPAFRSEKHTAAEALFARPAEGEK